MTSTRVIVGHKQELLEVEAIIEGLKAEGGISECLKTKFGKRVLILIVVQIDGEIVIIHLIMGKED